MRNGELAIHECNVVVALGCVARHGDGIRSYVVAWLAQERVLDDALSIASLQSRNLNRVLGLLLAILLARIIRLHSRSSWSY